MKVSYNWLKALLNLEKHDLESVVNAISFHSIEVETVEPVAVGDHLVVGYVLEKVKHPQADKLSVCQVDVGNQVLQIVCGAPNVDSGLKVIVALPGAKLPKITIKESVIRGISSSGMLCSLEELGVDPKYLGNTHGIYLLGEDAIIGSDPLEYLQLNDYTITLGLTPNRMDLLSMTGVANDLKAILKTNLLPLTYQLNESKTLTSNHLKLELATDKCLSYRARIINNLKIAESPEFIKARLIASGIRPINNVVDITNYILLLFGQPLHAFDTNLLKDQITVRLAHPGEEVVTLDHQTRILNPQDIVITDGLKVVCIAGVMGCSNTSVTDQTTSVTLEAAVFDPGSIRLTSARLGLRSEASVRYERGVDLNQTSLALDYACYLLEKYAGGEVLKDQVVAGQVATTNLPIKITTQQINNYLGTNLTNDQVITFFESLNFKVTTDNLPNQFLVVVPTLRMDLKIKEDLIEEIARLYGYNNIEETLPQMNLGAGLTTSQKRLRLINNCLVENGLNEVITYSLTLNDPDAFKGLYPSLDKISLLHPMSEEHASLRHSLIPSLVEVSKYNISRKNTDLAIFELGTHYYYNQAQKPEETNVLAILGCGEFNQLKWQQKTLVWDFYLLKGIIDKLVTRLGIKVSFQPLTLDIKELHPKRSADIIYNQQIIGYCGALHPEYTHQQEIGDTYVAEIMIDNILNAPVSVIEYQPVAKTHPVERDLAIVMDQAINVGEVVETIYQVDSMIKKVLVFDIYSGDKIGPNLKSVAFKITLVGSVTLTEEVINIQVKKILHSLEEKYQATLRQ